MISILNKSAIAQERFRKMMRDMSGYEVEGAAEGALSVLLADFIGDDLLDVADDIAVGIGEVDVEVRGDEAGAYGLELVEVQAEAHKENDLVSIKYLANSCFTVLVHDEFQMYPREVKV